MEIRIRVGPDLIERIESESDEDCTCPCLNCIEGTHCGGVYQDDGATIGECHEIVDDGPVVGYWPPDEDVEE